MSAVHAIARFAPLLSLLGCGLELEGTGGRTEPDDRSDTRPTAQLDAAVAERGPRDGGEPVAADASIDASEHALPVDASTTCSFAGTFAMRLEFDVDWQGTSIGIGLASRSLIAAGSGTLVIYTAATVRAQSGELVASLAPCGAEVPDFRSASVFTASEVYGVYVPDPAWDHVAMPRWDVVWRPACVDPGCAMRSSAFAGWIGAEHAPLDAVRADLLPIDVDGDGNAGITFLTRRPGEHSVSGQAYTQPPIDIALPSPFRAPSRAHEVMLAIGMGAHLDGTIQSCDRIEGEGEAGTVRVAAFGCTSEEGTSLASCPATVARSVDAKLPAYQVRRARYRTERVVDNRCESVRATFRGR
ncbi:MAG: hypothetical protein ABW252_24180 [Polyangiales bacterium]